MSDMQNNQEDAVIIFSKWPELGKCKKRIEKETSAQFALLFSQACLDDLISNIGKSKYYDLYVGANTSKELALFEEHYGLSGILTEGMILSEKFHNTFSVLVNEMGYKRVILIPMDLPFLSEEELIHAFAWLNKSPFVHGPESNGGIYLIGIRATYERNIFHGVKWSTPTAFCNLIENCGIRNVHILKIREDFNSLKDVLYSEYNLKNNCPQLFDLLVQKGYLPKDKYINFDKLDIPLAVAIGVILRQDSDALEILIQTRWKPKVDPTYTGLLELPSGLVHRYEPATEAAVREVKEETGLEVEIISYPPIYSLSLKRYKGAHSDTAISYSPFLCIQQTQGGRSYIGMAFLCKVVGGELRANPTESKNPVWVKLSKLKEMLKNNLHTTFTPSIPVLFHVHHEFNVNKEYFYSIFK